LVTVAQHRYRRAEDFLRLFDDLVGIEAVLDTGEQRRQLAGDLKQPGNADELADHAQAIERRRVDRRYLTPREALRHGERTTFAESALAAEDTDFTIDGRRQSIVQRQTDRAEQLALLLRPDQC